MFKKYYQALSLFLIAVSLYYAFTSLSPSSEITTAKTPESFSVEKALDHLQEISKKPHFTGAAEHVLVRNYIVHELEKLGLEVEVQTQMGLNYRSKSAANTRNILARIKGRTKGKALMLLSHYDSAPHASLGASDAGSGVVTILEGVRAFLASNQPPENDVIICFTDAEELGLLGAKAFVHHHPWAQEIGLALNFEARGSGGPSFMLLETNGGNQALIKAFQKASVPYPSANSLMYSVYKMLPNDTDLTVFREGAHIQGFNFAFIDDHFDYHTAQDRWERLDIRSLKHQASYLEAALYYFANTDLVNLSSKTDQVYFSLPFVGLLSYPFSWIAPTFALCVLLFALLIMVGFLKKKLTKIGVLKGFVPLIFALLTSSLLAVFGWRLLLEIHPSYRNILHGFPYNGPYYMGAFISLTLAICFWSYKGFFTKRSLQDLLIAPLTVWLLINTAVIFYLPGAAFFILPVVLLLLVLSLRFFWDSSEKIGYLFLLLSIPFIAIFAPMIWLFPIALGLKALMVATVATVLLFGLLVPVFYPYKAKKTMAKGFLLVGLSLIVLATFLSGFDRENRRPNSIIYVLDTDTNEAYWATYDTAIDPFTEQFLGKNPRKGDYNTQTRLSKYKTGISFHQKAAVNTFKKPIIEVVSDTTLVDKRHIRLRISSLRKAHKIELLANTPIRFDSFVVNGTPFYRTSSATDFEVNSGTILQYYLSAPDEKIDIDIIFDQHQALNLKVLEAKYDLLTNAQFDMIPRSATMMPMPFVLNDATILSTTIKL